MDLRQQLGVETPEHVEVHLELAGVGSRTAAAFFDTVLLNLGVILIVVVARTIGTRLSGAVEGWLMAALVLLYYFAVLGYFVLFEALNGGRRLGKQALGIRVVMATGHPITPTAAVVRNLVRLLDCYFPLLPVLPGLLFVFLQRRNQRPGDLAAGTVVVRDRPSDWSLGPVGETPAGEPVESGPPDLSDDEVRLLGQVMARREQLEPPVGLRPVGEVARRLEAPRPRPPTDTEAYLATLLAEEQRKRRSRFATRARERGSGRTTVAAERFVARKRAAWDAFRAVAIRVERAGVGALPPDEIPAFAARYREVAADLARGRTYGVDPRVISYLERLVSAGHNALYRSRSQRRAPLGRYLLADFPAAVVQSWRYVVVAFVLFMVPGLVGYTMLR